MLDACVCVLAGACLSGHLVGGGFALEQEVAKVCLRCVAAKRKGFFTSGDDLCSLSIREFWMLFRIEGEG